MKNAIAHGTGATRLVVSVDQGGAISVSDDGPGIPEKLRERIFERFQRVPGVKGVGKGLGLAIVSRIVEAHGGTITVKDGLGKNGPGGKGACFTIQLRR